jgi:hypothetical protein
MKKRQGKLSRLFQKKLLLFRLGIKDLTSAIGTAVRAGVVRPTGFAALWTCHQLGQGQMMM